MPKMKRAKPHPPWGASKQQAAHYEEVRALKNQIHELEAKLRFAMAELSTPVPTRSTGIDLIKIEVLEGRLEELRSVVIMFATGKVTT